MLDASFSFDGVVGAFAITDMIFVIALGLGIGACYIRALTVYLVRKGTLAEYVYLEHGAHWAIGALAVLLFVTIRVEGSRLVTGLIGVGFIGAALVSSIVRNRRAGPTGPRGIASAGTARDVRSTALAATPAGTGTPGGSYHADRLHQAPPGAAQGGGVSLSKVTLTKNAPTVSLSKQRRQRRAASSGST